MKLKRAHNMTSQDAIAWVDTKIVEMLEEFGDSVSGVEKSLNGNVLKFQFRAARLVKFEGKLTVTDRDFDLDLPFPLLARSKEGRAREEINRWLDQNLPGS